MGEIAEAMLDGTLCEGCGEYIGNAIGYPRYCSKSCEPKDYRAQPATTIRRLPKPHIRAETARNAAKKHPCPECGKRFKYAGAAKQHRLDKHGSNGSVF